jgi:hypothetical protein
LKTALLLRIASALTFVHALLHTVGGVFGKPEPGAMSAAVDAMKSYQFHVMGVDRTFWDFHMGEGLFITVSLCLQTVLLWQLTPIAKADPRRARPMIVTFTVAFLISSVLSGKYFFSGPMITEILIALVLAAAWFLARPLGVA